MISWIVCALALLGWIVLPGLGAATLGADEDDPGPIFARATAAGTATWFLGSQVLSESVGIRPSSSWIGCALAATIGSLLLARGRGWRIVWSRRREAATGLAVIAVILVAWAPVYALSLERPMSFVQSTPWYYWLNAETVADEGRAPATTEEFGIETTFLDDYPGFTAGTAALIAQTPGDDHRPAHAVMLVSVVSAVVGLGAVLRMFGGGRVETAVAGLLFLSLGTFAAKLASYRPESMGYGLALLATALAASWLVDRRRDALFVGAAAVVALGQVHGIALMFAAALVAAVLVGFVPRLWTRGTDGLRRASALALGWGGAWALWTYGINRSLSGVEQVDQLGNATGLADPTWDFIRAIAAAEPSTPPTNGDLASEAFQQTFVDLGVLWTAFVVVIVLGLVAMVAVRGAQPDRSRARRFLVFTLVALAVAVALSLWFATSWDSYVPRRTGFSRLVPLLAMLVPIGVATAIAVSGRRRRIVAAVALVAVLALSVRTAQKQAARLDPLQPSEVALDSLRDLELPPDALVLANGYTEGFIPAVLGAHGLVDGRAPYTYGNLLDRSITLLRGAKDFYGSPDESRQYLYDHGVTHVITAELGTWDIGRGARIPFDEAALEQSPALRRIAQTETIAVYEVLGR